MPTVCGINGPIDAARGQQDRASLPQLGVTHMKFLRFAPLAPVCLALTGCPSAVSQFKSNASFDKDSNARVTYLYMTNSDGPATITDPGEIQSGSSSANITADGAKATLQLPTGSVVTGQEVARDASVDGAEYYGDQHNSVVVQRTPGLNEEDDTFLSYHEQNTSGTPQLSPQVTQLARGYSGTRSDASVVAGLRSQENHSATYSGTGSAYIGQGDYAYFVDGGLQMTAQFGGADVGLSGQIMQTDPVDLQTNPNGVNRVSFKGEFIDDSPDYKIGAIKLNATGAASTDNPDGQIATISNGGGVGSFFGSHAQGTMGAFAGSGETTDAGKSPVRIIGSFQGKTGDNNPQD
jgi:hypothetical protein